MARKREGSAKFIGRNRPPRVQIEYEVDTGNAKERVELPFVMGVLSDLSGDAERAEITERRFEEFDADNLNDRMQGIKPKAAFRVPNRLTGEGEIGVDLSFESMDDFTPASIARRMDSTRKLLESRELLQNLLAVTDGRAGAEKLLQKIADAGPAGWERVLEILGKSDNESVGSMLPTDSEPSK